MAYRLFFLNWGTAKGHGLSTFLFTGQPISVSAILVPLPEIPPKVLALKEVMDVIRFGATTLPLAGWVTDPRRPEQGRKQRLAAFLRTLGDMDYDGTVILELNTRSDLETSLERLQMFR